MTLSDQQIVVYHYSFSPYARRVTWYLALRGIQYAEVKVPPVMPRPDLQAIGVNYRRIPVVAIGKDVYCDTRLILDKLEKFHPEGALGSADPDQKALQKLLEIWMVEASVFARGTQLIPTEMPLLNDPVFTKDREQFSGRSWKKEDVAKGRPEAVVYIRNCFNILETTLLADGRNWVLRTDKPTLADIEAVWVFDWLNGLKGGLPKDLISETSYPKVFAWIRRFNAALKDAKANAPKPKTLKGDVAAQQILNANFVQSEGQVDSSDPLGLQSGTEVEVFPTDGGGSHKCRGSLFALDEEEVVIEPPNGIRLHFPRTGYRVRPAQENQSKL